MERDLRRHHPHRRTRNRRPQQVAEPTQSVKRCADHGCGSLPSSARRRIGAGPCRGWGELHTRLARRSYSSSRRRRRAPAPRSDRYAVRQRPGIVSARHRPCRRQPGARARITGLRDIRRYVRWRQKERRAKSVKAISMVALAADRVRGPSTSWRRRRRTAGSSPYLCSRGLSSTSRGRTVVDVVQVVDTQRPLVVM